MYSTRDHGLVALGAILVAAVSFGVVDVTVASGCGASGCPSGIPLVSITFAALGGLAALVSVIPAVTWIVDTVRDSRAGDRETEDAIDYETARKFARAARPRPVHDDDELS